MPDEGQSVVEHLPDSSALAFARSLFHAAEGQELFDREFAFSSAVSTYYSVFHLGSGLILAYCADPSPPGDPHAALRQELEKRWQKSPTLVSPNMRPDPAQDIRHSNLPVFLERELPEIAHSLGNRGSAGTLMDMREFVSYAPRMMRDGPVNVLYSGCRYEAAGFRRDLKKHLDRIDKFFCDSMQWMSLGGRNQVRLRILSGDFVLFEFAELRAYHPETVSERAWATYRSVCEHEGTDWRVYQGDPAVFHTDEDGQRERYAEVVRSFSCDSPIK